MKQFVTFVKKEFYHVFRDRKTLLLLFGLPIVQILLFGFALTNEVKESKILVCDYSRDEATREIIDKLQASDNFKVVKVINDYQEIEKQFKKGKLKMAVVFPEKFQESLSHENQASIQLIADASDPNTATTLVNYASGIIRDYQSELMGTMKFPYSIDVETRMMYNPRLEGATNFVPGVMALVLLLVCVLMTSVSIVREKENGTMEILLVSPFNPLMIIVTKTLPYLALSLVNLAIILILSTSVLGLEIKGSLMLLVAVSILFIITALSLGLLISNSTASQQAAMVISLMGMLLPTMMFTGFLFPLENMPLPLRVISNIVPSKWYYIIVKSVMIKGLGFSAIWKETLILLGMTLFLLAVSIKKFKIRLA